MKAIYLKVSEVKLITQFLTENEIILHPKISPHGRPNFTNYESQKFILILDRNILVKLLRLADEGTLKDEFSLKLVSSLFLWTQLNGVGITAGIALSEYANYQSDSDEASLENNKFLSIFNYYDLQYWVDLATGKIKSIPKINISPINSINFNVESDHYKMHYLEMLKISQLHLNNNLSIVDRFHLFHSWVYKDILICKYTTFYAAMVFSGNSKLFKNKNYSFEDVIKVCRNQAWDLTYLSIWSTFYYYETACDEIYLFATHDKELKELFKITHQENYGYFITKLFKKKSGEDIIKSVQNCFFIRDKPEINPLRLDEMIINETEVLKKILNNQ